jgi:hypothetical protein
MSSVSVFVDDAVRGRFPNVCAMTGEPADGVVRIEQRSGGVGVGWLLVFLGPIGWIVLAVLAATARTEILTVRVPMSAAAAAREPRRNQWRLIAALASLGLFTAGLLRVEPIPSVVWLTAAAIAAVAAIGFHIAMRWGQIGVELDASRRWVTLSRVHPAFVAAVTEDIEARHLSEHST